MYSNGNLVAVSVLALSLSIRRTISWSSSFKHMMMLSRIGVSRNFCKDGTNRLRLGRFVDFCNKIHLAWSTVTRLYGVYTWCYASM